MNYFGISIGEQRILQAVCSADRIRLRYAEIHYKN